MTVTEILRYLGMGLETTFGTKVSATQHVDISSSSLDSPSNAEVIVPSGMGRGATRKKRGFYSPSGNAAYAFDINTIGIPLICALGEYVYTASGGRYAYGTWSDLSGGASTTIKTGAAASATDEEITVTSATGIVPGDVLRVGAAENDPDLEFVTVLEVAAGVLTILEALKYDHAAGTEVVEITKVYTAKSGGGSTTILAENPAIPTDTHVDATDDTDFATGDIISIGTGTTIEYRVLTDVTEDVLTFLGQPLANNHAAGEAIVEVERTGPTETELHLHEIYASNLIDLPSFTAELGKDAFEHVFTGCVMDTLGLAIGDGLCTATMGIKARKDEKATLKAPAALTLPTGYPLSFYEVTASLGGTDISADVNALNVNIANSTSAERGRGIGSPYPARIPAGPRDLTNKATLKFADSTYYEKFWGGASGPVNAGATIEELSMWFMAADGMMQFYYPTVYIESQQAQPSGRDEITQNVTWRALTDPDLLLEDAVTEVSTELLIKLWNSDTAYISE